MPKALQKDSDPPPIKQHDMPLQIRLADIQSGEKVEQEAENNIFNVVFTTGSRVRRYDFWNDREYEEELIVAPENLRLDRLNSGAAPVLDTHNSYTVDAVRGVVVGGSAKIENNQGIAQIKLDDGVENESVLRKVRNGILKSVSIGYRVYKYEITLQEGMLPLYRAVDWEVYEISLVPVPADAGASIRRQPHQFPCQFIDISKKQETRTMPMPLHPSDATTPPQTSSVSPSVEEIRSQERERTLEIIKITRSANLPDTFSQKLVEDGTSIDQARKAVLDELATRNQQEGQIQSQISIARDEVDSTRGLVENALLHRHNPQKHPLENGAREYRGMTLMEIGRELLSKRGVCVRGLSKTEVAGSMLGLETRGGGFHSTSDFPYILANVANKTLRDAYEAAPQTFKPFCRQTTNPDFKTVARTQLGDAPSLEKVNESGEFKRGTVGEAREQYALATYGKVVAVSRQTIINDDLGAFTRLPEMFGRAAADLESDTVWGIITANAAMGDGTALFHANHTNLAGSGATISVSTLGDARAALRKQKGLNGRFINIMAKYLLVPASLETLAEQFVTQTNIIYTKSTDYNPFANKLQVIAEPRLDANSATAWYLSADPAQLDTIEYAYLEGQEGVYLESRTGFDVDGVELKARLDFAAKAIDYRGFWKNAGV